MIGTLRHHSTTVHVAVKALRQAPINMIALETTPEGILSLIIPECILITRMSITMVVKSVSYTHLTLPTIYSV